MRFVLKTFGCKTNQYETQAIREALIAEGHCECAQVSAAEFLIVNTCAVTSRAEAAWRNFTAAAKRQNGDLRLIVTGCAANIAPETAEKFAAEKIFRNAQKTEIAAYFRPPEKQNFPANTPFAIKNFSGRQRALLKIQDGCDNACGYCVIPRARGGARSRPFAEIIAEAEQLAAHNYREIGLTGINIGAYRDRENSLAELCRELAKIPNLARLRLGSIEPPALDDRLLLAIRDNPKICRHLHLPLQSGDDRLLQLMQRHYSLRDYLATVERARKILDTPAITTDFMVGLPTEDENSFAANRRVLREIGFARAHIFLYSPRPDTPLAKIPRENFRRNHEAKIALTALAAQTAAAFAQSLIGKSENVIIEKKTPRPEGCGERYLRVIVDDAPLSKISIGNLVSVEISAAENNILHGKLLAK